MTRQYQVTSQMNFTFQPYSDLRPDLVAFSNSSNEAMWKHACVIRGGLLELYPGCC